jgi:hypothetical protein
VNDVEVSRLMEAILSKIALADEGGRTSSDDVRKLGYTAENSTRLCTGLKAAGRPVLHSLSGELRGIGYTINRDGKGLEHHKLRVLLGENTLSLDLAGEFAQRLVVKLEGVLAGGIRGPITVSSFAKIVPRGTRTFVNHVASVKDSRGLEVKAVKDHFRTVQEIVDAATSRVRSPEAKAGERRAVKVDYFAQLAQVLATRPPMLASESS